MITVSVNTFFPVFWDSQTGKQGSTQLLSNSDGKKQQVAGDDRIILTLVSFCCCLKTLQPPWARGTKNQKEQFRHNNSPDLERQKITISSDFCFTRQKVSLYECIWKVALWMSEVEETFIPTFQNVHINVTILAFHPIIHPQSEFNEL